MSLVVITGGLNEEQISFIKEAMEQSFGTGTITVDSFELSDISLVKELRLRVNDPSVVSVFLGEFTGITSLEKTRSILERSGKFLKVNSTIELVNYLNHTYDLELEYVESSSDSLENSNEPSPSVVDLVDKNAISELEDKYSRLLSAKDSTIRSLELQLKEQRDSYEYLLEGVSAKSNTTDNSEELQKANNRISELESLVEELKLGNSKVSSLEDLVSSLRKEKSDIYSKFASADSLSRSQANVISELRSKLEENKNNEVDLSSYKVKISALESDISNKDSIISELESSIRDLRISLEDEKKNVISLNKKLLSSEPTYSEYTEPKNLDNLIELPTELSQKVTGTLWDSSRGAFTNIKFLFAGSGDSQRDAYIHAEGVLSSLPNGGIFYDLSNDSVADYRFGVRKTKDSSLWYSDSKESLKNYLSKTKYPDVYVLGSMGGSVNEMSHFTLDLYGRLSYLDSLNVSVLVYGGDISSFFARNLMASALVGSSVEVVCRGLGTSARSMYFNSKMVSGSLRGKYYLVGKIDNICKKVMKVANRDGYDWRSLDA